MSEFIRCDEKDIPHVVQSVRELYGHKYDAWLFDGQQFEFYDYEIERQLGRPIESTDPEKVDAAIEVLAERKYWQQKEERA